MDEASLEGALNDVTGNWPTWPSRQRSSTNSFKRASTNFRTCWTISGSASSIRRSIWKRPGARTSISASSWRRATAARVNRRRRSRGSGRSNTVPPTWGGVFPAILSVRFGREHHCRTDGEDEKRGYGRFVITFDICETLLRTRVYAFAGIRGKVHGRFCRYLQCHGNWPVGLNEHGTLLRHITIDNTMQGSRSGCNTMTLNAVH